MTPTELSLLLVAVAYVNSAVSFYLFQRALIDNLEVSSQQKTVKFRSIIQKRRKEISGSLVMRTIFWPYYLLIHDKKTKK